MRTLIVSDLHLGQRPEHDVLRRPEARAALLDALDDVDRLVLLGDVVENASRLRGRRTMEIAAPVLRALAERLGPEREIVIVPGNHDSDLIRAWALSRGAELGTADEVPLDATPALADLTSHLNATRVSVRYPGLWVRPDVWATHGHYLDRHLIPESTFGLPRGRLAARGGRVSAIEYEWPRRRSATSRRRDLFERPLATILETLAELTRYGTYLLRGAHLTRLTAGLLDRQVRHAAAPSAALVAARLGVSADWVVFGHVHRAGPRDGEPEWRPRRDGPRLVNTGSWVYEPLLLDRLSAPHPYWPGGAVLVGDDGPPRVLGLLDGVTGERLAGGRRRPAE